jgi:FixJ family two-component response regulator
MIQAMPQHCEVPAKRMRIVIVDDDIAVCMSLKFALEIEGFDVRAYTDPGQFLGEAELLDCDCLIVDQVMPGMTGLELIAGLRARNVDAPALLITGHSTRELCARAEHAGVIVVDKPLLGSMLLDSIRRVTAQNAPPAA